MHIGWVRIPYIYWWHIDITDIYLQLCHIVKTYARIIADYCAQDCLPDRQHQHYLMTLALYTLKQITYVKQKYLATTLSISAKKDIITLTE